MKITNRRYIHLETNEEGAIMVFKQTRLQWETQITPGNKVGKLLSADGRMALFFSCPVDINYRVAMGVAGSYARHTFVTWDIPF